MSEHLENYGVSTDLVYQLERARLSLERMSALVAFRAPDGRQPRAVAQFVAALIRANAAQTSVRALISENSFLLARRIVESARKTGEHYITRDFGEYRAMLASAAIGGALTGVTVTVKLVTTGHGLPPFVEGLVASVNYALSFVLIHLLHGTLATKQPAMTAATMADHLNNARTQRPRCAGSCPRSRTWCARRWPRSRATCCWSCPPRCCCRRCCCSRGSATCPTTSMRGNTSRSSRSWARPRSTRR